MSHDRLLYSKDPEVMGNTVDCVLINLIGREVNARISYEYQDTKYGRMVTHVVAAGSDWLDDLDDQIKSVIREELGNDTEFQCLINVI